MNVDNWFLLDGKAVEVNVNDIQFSIVKFIWLYSCFKSLIEINDFIPFNDGIAETNNDVVNIFKNGINFMHLLEKDDRDIEVVISNDKESIILSNLSDFNKTHNLSSPLC